MAAVARHLELPIKQARQTRTERRPVVEILLDRDLLGLDSDEAYGELKARLASAARLRFRQVLIVVDDLPRVFLAPRSPVHIHAPGSSKRMYNLVSGFVVEAIQDACSAT
ncbi:MAG: hypothetical protein JJU27_11895 [Gammaproteobacteria bacterium]|nr:hypothetical protein [Gammaproteobacteria bacterium]